MTDPSEQFPPNATATPASALPWEWEEASYLPPRHPERKRAEADARAGGPDALAAFLAACAENDALRNLSGEVALPAPLHASLIHLPDGVVLSSGSQVATVTPTAPAPPISRRLAFRPTARMGIAAAFLLATMGLLVYQANDEFNLLAALGGSRGVVETVGSAIAAQATLQPQPAGQPIATASPAEARQALAARFDRFTPQVLDPAPGYVLQSVGITELAGHPALFAIYASTAGDGGNVYAVYQLSSKDLGATDSDYGIHENCAETRVKIWPNPSQGCTWVLVSGPNNPITLVGY